MDIQEFLIVERLADALRRIRFEASIHEDNYAGPDLLRDSLKNVTTIVNEVMEADDGETN